MVRASSTSGAKKSPGYFVGRPIILDVAALPLDKDGLATLIADLSERDIRIMGVEGTKASWLGLGMPPLVSGSRAASDNELAGVSAAGRRQPPGRAAACPGQAKAPRLPPSLSRRRRSRSASRRRCCTTARCAPASR